MNESKISVRYAKALFTAGKEDNSLNVLKKDIEFLYQGIGEIPELQYVIQSPVIRTKEKIRLFEVAFKSIFSQLTFTFIRLVLENRREEYLAGMARYFLDLLKTDQNIQSAEFISAASINEKIRKSITQLIEQKFKSSVELQETVDKNIIGGYILRVGDLQIDASIASKLKLIKKELIEINS
ncbi:MAG: ATP synthase F1 subunit delta [Bacteroidales bacterium]|nr:ATP synthase F1 subunit delta [Bacteroidales bacterium]